MKLAALVITKPEATNGNGLYRAIKLFNDGSSEPVSRDKTDLAIDWLQNHGYRPQGFWLNHAPAIVLGITGDDFLAAWNAPRPPLACPCTLQRRLWQERRGRVVSETMWIGERYVVVPTRDRWMIQALRARYPYWPGDLLFVPGEILDRHHALAQARSDEQTRQLQATPNHHANLAILRCT